MKRRDFVKASLSLSATGLTVPAAVGQGSEPASRPRPGILELAGQKQLFLDDWLIEEANRISRFMVRPWKYPGNPILERDRPWEMGDIAGYFRGVQIFGQSVATGRAGWVPGTTYRSPWRHFPKTDGWACWPVLSKGRF